MIQVVPHRRSPGSSRPTQGAGERAAHRLRRHVGDEVTARAAAVARQRRHRAHRRRRHRVQRVAVARARRRVARRVDGPHRQRAGARRQRHAAGAERVAPAVAVTQVVPPLALTWIVSPDPGSR